MDLINANTNKTSKTGKKEKTRKERLGKGKRRKQKQFREKKAPQTQQRSPQRELERGSLTVGSRNPKPKVLVTRAESGMPSP